MHWALPHTSFSFTRIRTHMICEILHFPLQAPHAASRCHKSRKALAPSCGLCHVAVAGVGQRGMRVRSGPCGNETTQRTCRHAAARSGTIGKRAAQLACACSKCTCTATRIAQRVRAKGKRRTGCLTCVKRVERCQQNRCSRAVAGQTVRPCSMCSHASPWCSCLAMSARTKHQFLDCGRM